MDIMKELPMGFGMALVKNEQALQKFTQMTEPQKQDILAKTHQIESKAEMQALVNQLSQS